ncbi:methylmalonic aciduria and homocystinuria type C protein homolog isoform X2 [Argonauta hians]
MEKDPEKITESVNKITSDFGFEARPFKISWYNDLVDSQYKLDYPPDTLAVIVVNSPSMFEKGYKPYLYEYYTEECQNPLNDSIKYYMKKVQEVYPDTDVMYDFDMIGGYPKILVQTAAHIAGIAYYYQKKDIIDNPWGDKSIFGMSLHPKYGGWFAMRAVFVFKNVEVPGLVKTNPPDVLKTQELKKKFLNMLNEECDYWGSRDIIDVTEKYSEEALKYFKAKPDDRKMLIEEMLKNKK